MDTSTNSNVTFASEILTYTSHLDFLRLTAERGGLNNRLHAPISEIQLAEKQDGHKQRPYNISDMRGMITGHAAWAQSKTHLLVEFRGALAETVFPLYQNVTSKASRIDVAVTVWLESHDKDIARQCYHIATQHMKDKHLEKVRKMPVYVKSENGDTCYLGSRSSERYVRIYDKWLQSKDEFYENAWRFEIEFKGDKAQVVWQQIQSEGETEATSLSEVAYGLKSYNITVAGLRPILASTKIQYRPTPKDIETKLVWLQKQVRPTLQELSDRGFREAALAVLGIHQEGTGET